MPSPILAVLTDPGSAGTCLDAAAMAAERSRPIAALHIRIAPESLIMPTEEVMTAARRRRLEEAAAERSRALRAAFDEWARGAGPAAARTRWQEVVGTVEAEIAARGKVAELVVLARPSEHEGQEALHAALFETGRLLLHVPSSWSGRFGDHIAIAWKDCDQARAAVAAATPFLKRARRVSVIAVGAGRAPDPPQALLARLKESGIAAEPVMVAQEGHDTGARLLSAADAAGADCIVMGAYRHGELIERLLGGVTRHMLRAAEIPLFLHR